MGCLGLIGLFIAQTIMVWLGWNILVAFGIGMIFSVSIPTISLVQSFFFGIILSIIKYVFFSSSGR